MPRIMLVGLCVAFLVAVPFAPRLEMGFGLSFSSPARAAENPNSTRQKTNRPDHFIKRGKQDGGGGKAGLAVSDEGASGSKPSKKNK